MSEPLFIYAKEGRIRCLTQNQWREGGRLVESEGYSHTATIQDPGDWIEQLANGGTDPSDMLDELQFKPTTTNQ